MLFSGGTMKTIHSKDTDTFILEMGNNGVNVSNDFCASLLKTYFEKQLSILKINNMQILLYNHHRNLGIIF